MFDLRKAQTISMETQNKYKKSVNNVKWNEVYNNEQEIIDDLKKVYIPKESELILLHNIYMGYDFIHSFAKQIKSGKTLSEKQITQCKRLALEIKKASNIADCWK